MMHNTRRLSRPMQTTTLRGTGHSSAMSKVMDRIFKCFTPDLTAIQRTGPVPNRIPPMTPKEIATKISRRGLRQEGFSSLKQRALVAQTHLLLFSQTLKEALQELYHLEDKEIDRIITKIVYPCGASALSRINSSELSSYKNIEEENEFLLTKGFPALPLNTSNGKAENPVFAHLDDVGTASLFLGSTQSQAENILQLGTQQILLKYKPCSAIGLDVSALSQFFEDYPLLGTITFENRVPSFFLEESEFMVPRWIPGENILAIRRGVSSEGSITHQDQRTPFILHCHQLNEKLYDDLRSNNCFLD